MTRACVLEGGLSVEVLESGVDVESDISSGFLVGIGGIVDGFWDDDVYSSDGIYHFFESRKIYCRIVRDFHSEHHFDFRFGS